jgi:hypothetical protein
MASRGANYRRIFSEGVPFGLAERKAGDQNILDPVVDPNVLHPMVGFPNAVAPFLRQAFLVAAA